MKSIILKSSFIVFIGFVFLACEMLPLQQNFHYDGEAIDIHVNMSAYDWLYSKGDEFNKMIEAIEYAEMSDYYKQDSLEYTFLVIKNTALENWANNNGVLEISDLPKDKVRNFIKYHIIKGRYAVYYNESPIEPSFVKTLLNGEDGLMTLNCVKSSYPIYYTNDGPVITSGNIMINALYSNGSSPQRSSHTTNIITLNGVIHVFGDYSFYKRDVYYNPLF